MGWRGPLSQRQAEAWVEWLEMQWNEPDRSDYYAMQTAATYLGAKTGKPIAPGKLKIKFTTKSEQTEELTPEQIRLNTLAAKSRSLAKFQGTKVRKRTRHKDGTITDDPES